MKIVSMQHEIDVMASKINEGDKKVSVATLRIRQEKDDLQEKLNQALYEAERSHEELVSVENCLSKSRDEIKNYKQLYDNERNQNGKEWDGIRDRTEDLERDNEDLKRQLSSKAAEIRDSDARARTAQQSFFECQERLAAKEHALQKGLDSMQRENASVLEQKLRVTRDAEQRLHGAAENELRLEQNVSW